MPLYKKIQHNSHTILYIWKIEESQHQLEKGLDLQPKTRKRMEAMKSEMHRKGFLSVRHLLHAAGYTDYDLSYDDNGKPHLQDGKCISITHSFTYAAIAVSEENVGVDIEMQREKICRIADKFIGDEEFEVFAPLKTSVAWLTVFWGAKEAMYKMCNSQSLSFRDNMRIHSVDWETRRGVCEVSSPVHTGCYLFEFLEFDNFTLVFTLEKKS